MSGTSTIEWTDATWNPVTGCSHVSPGCDHCYAEALTMRYAKAWKVPGLPWTPENAAENVILKPERLDAPLKWRKPRMVFVNSMSDLFHPRVPAEYIAQVFDVMERCPQHTFQVLTKRPKRMASWCRKFQPSPLPNVWLGTSIESREFVGRADALRETSAAVRFISAEPLLGPLVTGPMARWRDADGTTGWREDGQTIKELNLRGIDWLIVGGESGQKHRPIEEQWVLDLRDACFYRNLGRTAFFFKQWGGRTPKAGGRELDGRTWDEYPASRSVAA